MKIGEKARQLQEQNLEEWLKTRAEVDAVLSKSQAMFCICGRLATGLHERSCRRFQHRVTSETVKRLWAPKA